MAALAQRIGELRTPIDHYRALVTDQQHDHLLWVKGRKDKDGREWYKLNNEVAVQELSRYTNEPEIFVTPNEFYGWRLIRLLSALNAFYVDIDVHDGDGCPVRAAWAAIDKISRAHLPEPNMVVYTGRGAHLYWLFERTPKHALPRWQVVQKVLVQLTAGDTQVLDATRVLRVVGTQNSQADRSRKTVTAEVLNPQRYQFDWLCEQIMHIPRAEIRDIRAARARKEALEGAISSRQAARHKANAGSIYQVWYHRYQDLIKISDAHWFGGVPPGFRNLMLLHMSISLSWFTKAEALTDEITHVARHHMPSFTESEINSTVSSVLKRARDAADGKMYEFQGMQVDPRYKFKAETLWDVFAPLVLEKPELIQELRAIIPPEEREKREAQRQEKRDRVQEGRYTHSRSEYLETADKRKNIARKLFSEGVSPKEIAIKLEVSQKTVERYIKDLKTQVSHCDKSAPLVYDKTTQETEKSNTDSGTQTISALREKGLSVRQIADMTGFSKSKVGRLLKSYPQSSAMSRCDKSPPLVCGRSPSRSDPVPEGRSLGIC